MVVMEEHSHSQPVVQINFLLKKHSFQNVKHHHLIMEVLFFLIIMVIVYYHIFVQMNVLQEVVVRFGVNSVIVLQNRIILIIYQ
jgi:hypothetical protein